MPLIIVFAIVGGLAQFVDGSLSMGFGITSATLLTLLGYSAVAASAGTHAAKMGTTLVSGLAHWREGNVDWRVLLAIGVPGSLGAFAGAVILTNVSLDGARVWMSLIPADSRDLDRDAIRFRQDVDPSGEGTYSSPVAGRVVRRVRGCHRRQGWGPVATPSL